MAPPPRVPPNGGQRSYINGPTPPQPNFPPAAGPEDAIGGDIQKKIDRERAILNGAQRMRGQANPAMQSTFDNQIRESRRNIEYLEGRMRELQMRRLGQDGLSDDSRNGRPSSSDQRGVQQRVSSGYLGGQQSQGMGVLREPDTGDYGNAGPGGYSDINTSHGMPSRPPFGPSGPGSSATKARPNYSRLGMSCGWMAMFPARLTKSTQI